VREYRWVACRIEDGAAVERQRVVVMIHKDVFEATKKPWYDVGWGSKGIIGEDVHFCVKALDNGFQTYVDHSLSMHIGHIGTYEYRWDDVEDGAVERHNSGK
jgi:hypothetical protein